MDEERIRRESFIKKALYEFRGGMARRFYYDSEEVPYVDYYYSPYDDMLHASGVSIPFHYKEEEISYEVILNSLETLNDAVIGYYKQKGITLYEYD